MAGAPSRKPRGNVGAEPDAFLGRDDELAALARTLDDGARLVTLLGPGGIGKTRLARRVAARRAASGREGAWACDLSAVRAPGDAELTLALALGLYVPKSGLSERVGEALRELGPALVVLDECDRAADAIAPALARWMASAPDVRWIATSRVVLGLPGEHVFEVGPLPVETAAAALFVERARAARAGWTPDDPALVVEIVRRLEGMPLAIELAAARARVLDLRTLHDRLARSFDVLATRARGRHASLRAAVEWSWEQLEPWERRALAQCSVFRGGFTLAAAEAVLDVGRPAVDAVQQLVDKSLVRAYPPDGFPGETRFGMYETVRAFAAESLGDDAGPTFERHARHHLEVGTAWEQSTWHGAIDSLRKLALERDNLLAIHARAREARDAPDVLASLIAIFPVFVSRGPFVELLALGEAAGDDACLAASPPLLRARYLLVRGRARQLAARHPASLADFQAALVASRAAGDRHLVARSLTHLGTAERLDGRLADARDRFEAALRLFEQESDPRATAVVLSALGAVDLLTGSLDAARAMLSRAIEGLAALGDDATRAMVLIDLGITEQERGAHDAARAAYDEAVAIHRAKENRRFVAIATGYRAGLDAELGALDEAVAGYEAALAIATTFRDLKLLATFGGGLAASVAARGDVARAAALAEEAERHAREQGEPRVVASAALHAARVSLARGDREAALASRAAAVGLTRVSDDVRYALRMLDAALEPGRPAAAMAAPADGRALVVAEDAAFVVPPGGARADLGKRESLKRVLMALVWRRVDAPGAPVSHADLVAAAWPGEKLAEAAALNRLNVALAELRKRGLRELVLRAEGGHLLDPRVPVILRRTGAGEAPPGA